MYTSTLPLEPELLHLAKMVQSKQQQQQQQDIRPMTGTKFYLRTPA